ncbi:MAG: YdbL family protein [Pseudomonas sp.]
MRMSMRMVSLLLALVVSAPVLALSLNEAMSALPTAKAAGQLGEQPDGYLGVVSPGGNAAAIAKQINDARRQEYQRLAGENNIQLRDVESMAGKKALERTPSGQYIMLNGVWMKK